MFQSKRRHRVLMVAPTCGVYGGIEAFTAEIAREVLADPDFEVRVVFRHRPGFDLRDDLHAGLERTHVSYRLMKRPDGAYLKDLLWADLIHCHFPLIYATAPARLLRKPLVITVENRFIPAEHRNLHHWGMKVADERWYISTFVGKTWEGSRLKSGSRIIPAVSELPYRQVAPESRSGFFFIARWVPLKGIEQLVEAYATARIDHASHRLALFGDGHLRADIERLIAEFNIGDFVDRPGFVEHEEKVRRMAGSRWNVAPAAFEEDLGLSPIEARSCGVPSIVTDIGGLPEAAGDRALLCKPGEVAGLRDALEKAAGMPADEYDSLSSWASDSLSDYLPVKGFYSAAFKNLLQPDLLPDA